MEHKLSASLHKAKHTTQIFFFHFIKQLKQTCNVADSSFDEQNTKLSI